MSVTQRVETTLTARLQDATYGYNVLLQSLAAGYELDPDDLLIDFGAGSNQFYVDVDAEDTEAEDTVYPWATLGVGRSDNQDLRKGTVGYFSGTVRASLQITISREGEKLPRVASTEANLIDEIMYRMFCSRVPGQIWRAQQVSPGVLWAGDLTGDRGDWRPGGENWIRTLVYTFTFEVEA